MKKKAMMIGDTSQYRAFRAVNMVLLSIIGLSCLLPIVNIFCISLSSPGQAASGKVLFWPKGFMIDAYRKIFANTMFWNSLKISVQRVILGTALNLTITLISSYALSRDSEYFKARQYYIWYFFFPALFGGGLIPTFLTIKFTGLYNTIWALIIPGCAGIWNCVLMLNFFRQLPKEIEEAAIVDGAGHPTILWKIIIPVSKPAIATVTLMVMVSHWNDWFSGMIYMASAKGYPLQTYLMSLLSIDLTMISDFRTRELAAMQVSTKTLRSAMVFVTALPIMLVYPLLQKYFTKGLILGSVKG